MACESLFCDRWMRNTIRNVTIVVPVFMTSCHVSENPKTGPVTPHTTIVPNAMTKAQELPDQVVTASEKVSSACPIPLLEFFFDISYYVSYRRTNPGGSLRSLGCRQCFLCFSQSIAEFIDLFV